MAGRRETVSDEEILGFFQDTTDPVLGTAEVAEFLDFSNPGTHKRLKPLAQEGLLESKKIGNSIAWWITEEGKAHLGEDVKA